jgi:hypothetical protein
MPRYLFRLVPDSGLQPVEFSFEEDDDALEAAKRVLQKVRKETASEGSSIAATLEVLRDDGTFVGIATAKEE